MTMEKENKYLRYFMNVVENLSPEEKIALRMQKKTYLARESDLESNVYVLVEGVIISSLVGTSGNKINLSFMNRPGLVTLLKEEDEQFVEQPYDIEVDSDTAIFYKINRLKFWKMVNNDEKLNYYVRNYYRNQLDENIKRFKLYIENNRTGQICSFLHECIKLFGIENTLNNEILIDHKITHKTIGEFCGIKSRSSVSRIMNELVDKKIIEQKKGLINVKDIDYLKSYIN